MTVARKKGKKSNKFENSIDGASNFSHEQSLDIQILDQEEVGKGADVTTKPKQRIVVEESDDMLFAERG